MPLHASLQRNLASSSLTAQQDEAPASRLGARKKSSRACIQSGCRKARDASEQRAREQANARSEAAGGDGERGEQ